MSEDFLRGDRVVIFTKDVYRYDVSGQTIDFPHGEEPQAAFASVEAVLPSFVLVTDVSVKIDSSDYRSNMHDWIVPITQIRKLEPLEMLGDVRL